MQFKVPQKIDMEDKIIGPLTMAQFLYVLVGGMIDYTLLQTIAPKYPLAFAAIAIPIALFTLAMAFLKVNDLTFPKFVQAALLYMVAPKYRVWGKTTEAGAATVLSQPAPKTEQHMVKTGIEKSEIEKLASVLDTAGWAAVRDTQLKEFVTTFDKSHHKVIETTVSEPGTRSANQAPGHAS